MKRRIAYRHTDTFHVGEMVFFRGTNEGPFLVTATTLLPTPEEDMREYGWDPEFVSSREGAGHHQHVTLDIGGKSPEVYSGAWLQKHTSDEDA